ncbi:hypothetical protein O181_000466 [Austropuccinia psidii MF-1]|uniref:Uncharacterized protein n=1 Tax=Austropuccinia psidii MF-1 TaxID=1389203 RepID=A0A9Q3GBL8_9BASI|nr:hypothetical protein [Austropuccinia psidii MF-1]
MRSESYATLKRRKRYETFENGYVHSRLCFGGGYEFAGFSHPPPQPRIAEGGKPLGRGITDSHFLSSLHCRGVEPLTSPCSRWQGPSLPLA